MSAGQVERNLPPTALSPEMFPVLRPNLALCLDDQPPEKRELAPILEIREIAQHFDHHGLAEVHRVIDPTESTVEPAPKGLLEMRAVLHVDPLDRGLISLRSPPDVSREDRIGADVHRRSITTTLPRCNLS